MCELFPFEPALLWCSAIYSSAIDCSEHRAQFHYFHRFSSFLSKISFLWMICSNLFVSTNSFLFFLSEYICFVSFVSVLLPQLSISHWFSPPPPFLSLFYLFSDDKFFTVLNIITFRHNFMVLLCRSIVRTKLLDKFSRSPARFNLFI